MHVEFGNLAFVNDDHLRGEQACVPAIHRQPMTYGRDTHKSIPTVAIRDYIDPSAVDWMTRIAMVMLDHQPDARHWVLLRIVESPHKAPSFWQRDGPLGAPIGVEAERLAVSRAEVSLTPPSRRCGAWQ